jgi:hypothetical protein
MLQLRRLLTLATGILLRAGLLSAVQSGCSGNQQH